MRLLPALLPAFAGPLILSIVAGCATAQSPAAAFPAATADRGALERAVRDTERAFARTMADRDHAAFTRFLSAEAVFFAGSVPLRGRDAVASAWKRFYEGPRPVLVGARDRSRCSTRASSRCPVARCTTRPASASRSFTSIWRQEAPGVWRIVFDKGCGCTEARD